MFNNYRNHKTIIGINVSSRSCLFIKIEYDDANTLY